MNLTKIMTSKYRKIINMVRVVSVEQRLHLIKLNYGLILFDLVLIVSVQFLRSCVRGHF